MRFSLIVSSSTCQSS